MGLHAPAEQALTVKQTYKWRSAQPAQPEASTASAVPVIVFSAAYEVAPRAADALTRWGVVKVLNKPADGTETLDAVSELFELIEPGV